MTPWLVAGAAAGAAQAALLAAGRPWSTGGPLARLLLAGVVLFFAARAGHLAPGAAGWAAGFAAASAAVLRRLR